MTDALEIHFIDMVKYRRLAERNLRGDALHRWLTWLDEESREEEIEEVIRMDRGIESASERMWYVAQDKEALHAYELREMALSDWTSGVNHARREGMERGIQKGMERGIQKGMEEGIQEGMEKGIEKGKQEIIDLLKSGKSPEEILKNYKAD